jgi:hypothetical protein
VTTTGSLGQQIGIQFGSFLGRQIALGACRDDPDDDFERRPYSAAAREIPTAVDLRPWMTRVEDQGALGSCTSNAIVGALEYLIRRETGTATDLSRLFVYYNQRLWDDCVRDDAGAAIATGIRVLARLGVPTEKSWPYDRNLFAVQPPEEAYREASQLRVIDWWSVGLDPRNVRGCLAAGFPVVFGTRCTESFMHPPPGGIVPMPGPGESANWRHGRHALLLVGYDDNEQLFVVRNSWGSDWGDFGYCYMPYAWVLNPDWTHSCWAVRLTERSDLSPTAKIDPRALPAAPPSRVGSSASTQAIGTIAASGAQVAIGMLTGSSMLAGLAGGLIAGLTPGIASRVKGRDSGAFVGRDRTNEILAALHAGGKPPAQLARMPWDDGLDERAQVAAITSSARTVVASGAERRAATTPVAASPVAPPTSSEIPPVIADAWTSAGGKGGPLGMPLPPAATMSEGNASGVAMRFVNGAIFAWTGQKPIVMPGTDHLLAAWLRLGAARSPLGWPTRSPAATPDGMGRALPCTRGVVFEHPTHGAHAVHGALHSYWASLGGFSSGLGFPLEDAQIPDDPTAPQSIRFEHGTLRWSPTAGATRS